MSRARPTKHRFTTAAKAREWLERKGFVAWGGNDWLHAQNEGSATLGKKDGEFLVTLYAPLQHPAAPHKQAPSSPKAAPEPDYSNATNDQLRLLAKHAKEQRIRVAAKAELSKRGEQADPLHDALLTKIALEHLRIETLEVRNSDSLDFKEVAVWSVQQALEAAYQAGLAAGKKRGRK